jgi:hypothetical protein
MAVEEAFTAAGAALMEGADSTAVEARTVAAMPVAGTTLTGVASTEEPRRAWAAHSGDPAGTHLVRMAIPPSAAECDPARTA